MLLETLYHSIKTGYCHEEAIRDQLGEAAFDEAFAVGTAMTGEQAITYALEATEMNQTTTSEAALSVNQKEAELLSDREIEVLALVANGLSNREIAGVLFLSVNTVKWYLKGVYDKLDVANRAEAVMQAQMLGVLSQE